MRWVYTAPERKEFVSDGAKIYSYLPADKQVIVSPVPAGDGHDPGAVPRPARATSCATSRLVA